mmetsp:Transcript_1014/g.1103  ORF Transcript_1014/g.1103 Transcript_1014/m.1103 type:complete len:172 (-) Transcript_1014:226-741(-)
MKERKELVRRKFILEHKQPTNERTTTTTERRMIEMNINKQIQTINTSNDHNRGRDGRRLEKDGRQNPDHDTGDGIGIITKQFSSRTTTHDFRTTAQQVQPKQKEIQKEEHNGNTNGNHAPFTGTMTTTRLEDFSPHVASSGISSCVNSSPPLLSWVGFCRFLPPVPSHHPQ